MYFFTVWLFVHVQSSDIIHVMVSLFPDLLTFALFAPFVIRLFLGVYFIVWGWKTTQKTGESAMRWKIIGFIGLISGVFVVVGFATQAVAIVLAAFSLYLARHATNRMPYILLLRMAISLLFSGAGFLAFDLPL